MSEATPAYKIIPQPGRREDSRGGRLGWVRRHGEFSLGAAILIAIILIAIVAPFVVPHDPYTPDILHRRQPPVWDLLLNANSKADWSHPFGTDPIGRDYLSRLMTGARVSLVIGSSAMLISAVIGITIGVLAGFFGGRTDNVANFIIATRLSLPVIIVALAVVAIYGGSTVIIACVLGGLLWDRFAVVARSTTLQVKNLEYIQAARAMGCSTRFILFHEVLPNVMGPLIVVATTEVAAAILLEASLSFLGLGVQPPTPAWGLMLSEAKKNLTTAPWLMLIPGVSIFVLVFAINLVGDGLRDIFAPERRG